MLNLWFSLIMGPKSFSQLKSTLDIYIGFTTCLISTHCCPSESSQLKNCSSLFASRTGLKFVRVQYVQNSLWREVTQSFNFSHITPQLRKKRHWLPVNYKLQFSIGQITFRIPVYFSKKHHPYISLKNTRHSCSNFKFLQVFQL